MKEYNHENYERYVRKYYRELEGVEMDAMFGVFEASVMKLIEFTATAKDPAETKKRLLRHLQWLVIETDLDFVEKIKVVDNAKQNHQGVN